MVYILAISKVSRFLLASVAEQAGLNLTWSKMPEDTFSLDEAQMKSNTLVFSNTAFSDINPHLPNGLSHPYRLDESIFHLRGVWCMFFIFIILLIEIPVSICLRPENGTPGLYELKSVALESST